MSLRTGRQNRVVFGRAIKKDREALLGVTSYLKQQLKLPLDQDEEQVERLIATQR